jgi:hypothetical protein
VRNDTVIDTTEYRLTRQVRSASAGSMTPGRRKPKPAVAEVVVLFVWRKVSPSAYLMVDLTSGARAVIRDTRLQAGRFHWSVVAAGEMHPTSEGRTDDLARAQSVAGTALREYAKHIAVASAREREGIA